METTTLIRIESTIDGMGIFQSSKNVDQHSQHIAIEDRHENMSKYPTIWNDKELLRQLSEELNAPNDLVTLYMDRHDDIIKYHCAFLTLEQFKEALTTEEIREFINDLDFRVYTLEVKHCIKSPYQAMYLPEDIITKTDISSLFL